MVCQRLKQVSWDEDKLAQTRKGDPVKVKLARQLRAETTMSHEWIANRLRMGRANRMCSTWTMEPSNEPKSVNSENRPLYDGVYIAPV